MIAIAAQLNFCIDFDLVYPSRSDTDGFRSGDFSASVNRTLDRRKEWLSSVLVAKIMECKADSINFRSLERTAFVAGIGFRFRKVSVEPPPPPRKKSGWPFFGATEA